MTTICEFSAKKGIVALLSRAWHTIDSVTGWLALSCSTLLLQRCSNHPYDHSILISQNHPLNNGNNFIVRFLMNSYKIKYIPHLVMNSIISSKVSGSNLREKLSNKEY
ncbi:hypothetical protein Anas_10802 [Armadillidium nasatum]|uniref:Uncharacterized protein n=1 Tax=Armadillidium nasatum TaxID=96803 RepID=A0A5N5TGA5_9CRUS|nr:hypothetical protein Anas_10802 [Armadillidium nasatum]